MKSRFLLFYLILTILPLHAQILITGAVDGPLTGGIPKAIEFYVYEDIADLSIYGVGSANNGGGTDGEEFTFPADAVTAGTFIYLATESEEFTNFFGFAPTYTDGSAASINGDDAIELFKDGSVFDVFGDINVDGTGTGWDYLDGWAYRVDETGPDGSTFVETNWTYSGTNALDGETTNATAANPFPLGTYSYGTVTTPPDAPVATTESNLTHESFSANWNASVGANTYYLDISEANDFSSFLTGFENMEVGNVNTYSVESLSPSTDYFYRVRAGNDIGISDNSNIISVTTSVQPQTIVQFKNASGSVIETGGTYNLVVTIQYPDDLVGTTADVVLTSGDATDLEGYSTTPVTFTAGSSANVTVPISITDDGVTEGTEYFTFELQNIIGGNSASVGTNSTFTLAVIEEPGGTYYDNIDPNVSTFVEDLKNRIRDPYTWVPYSQYDETNVANFSSIDNGDGTRSVFCVYSNYEYIYSGTFAWTLFSREHTFPHSWMPTNPADSPIERDEYADQHHLFPTHQDNANAVRSNHPLGVVSSISSTFLEAKFGSDASGNTVYEPRDEHKGDAARAILYMVLRYDDIDGYDWSFDWLNNHIQNDLGRDPQDLAQLISWHEQDPPDQWELDRNDYVQSIQGNRNPFVDHPEWVYLINFNTVEYNSTDLFFSEYVEGSSNNKALEIYNNTGASVDLSSLGYKIEIYSNGSSSVGSTVNISGTLADGDVFVIANSSADASILAISDQTSGSINYNGDDAVALVRGTEIVDVIGQIGVDPGSEWTNNGVSTLNMTMRRKSSIGSGDNNGSDAFDPSVEWNGYAEDTFDGLGTHSINAGPPTITSLARDIIIPTADENTTISASVSDDGSVSFATLRYSIDGGSYQEISMTNSTGSTYEAVIPNSAYTDGNLLEYWVYAEDGDATSAESKSDKVFIGTTPIVNLKELDANGVLVNLGVYARIEGVATVESGLFSTSSLDIYIQDANSAINVFKSSDLSVTVLRGYNYIVEGKLDQYNGKAEIIPDVLADNIIDADGVGSLAKTDGLGVLPDPIVMSIADFLADPETYEGMLVGIQHSSNTNGGDAWPAVDNNANVQITDDGGTNLLTLRVDKDTEIDGTSEPSWPKDLVGIFTQFYSSAPYVGGYQIQPRDLADIQEDGALPVELSTFSIQVNENSISLNWETATEVNNYGFEIERKQEESSWEKIGFVAGNGNSNSPKYYSYLDNSNLVTGKYSYRLKQIDIDGKFEYSNVIEVEIGIPTEYELLQNYPNPFNPTTTVSFSIPEKQNVNLILYNMLGEVVTEVVNKELNPGKYSFEINASELSSGTYIYRLTAGSFSEVRKMMLLK